MLQVSVMCFLASYLLAFGLEWTRFVSRSGMGRWITLGVGIAGFVAQTWFLLARAQQTNLPPLLSSMQDWLLVLAWLVVLMHLFISAADRELALGFIVWPLALVLIIASQFAASSAGASTNVHRNWAMLHVGLLVLGMAGVATALVASLLYLWQHWRMKHRVVSVAGFGLPSLERLAKVNRWTVLVSVPLLTFGMLIGLALTLSRSNEFAPSHLWTDPVVIVSGVCWLMMTAVFVWLVGRKRPTGRQVAWLSVWACGFLMLTTIGAQILSQTMSATALHGNQRQSTPHPGEPLP